MSILLEPVAYLPAVVLLLAATVNSAVRTNPKALMPLTLVNIIILGVTTSIATVAISTLVAVLVFVALVFTGLLTRSTTFVFPAALASLPALGWLALLPGIAAAAILGALRLRKVGGSYFVSMLASQTAESLGVHTVLVNNTLPTKPDLKQLPTDLGTQATLKVKTPLIMFLAISVACFAAASSIF